MKRKTSDAFVFILICGVVIVAGLGAGYFFVGNHAKTEVTTVQGPPPPVEAPPQAAPIHPRRIASAGEYTAPGAPSIAIHELKGAPPTRPSASDSEESQTGLPTPSTPPVLSDNSPDTSTTATPTTAAGPSSAPADDGSGSSPTPDDSDTNTATADSESGQAGADDTTPSGPVFHVQAGIFASERNAKILADALKRRGYTAVAEPSIDDSGKTMYRVQVGVYKSKSAASDAVLDLQRTGYPASLSTR